MSRLPIDRIPKAEFRSIPRQKRAPAERKLLRSLRSRITAAFSRGGSKCDSSTALIGCSVAELREKMEAKFLPGMTWDNYGQWHLDHIIPCAAFDLLNPEHQRACFHWSNLQPLWARDNLRKHSNIPITCSTMDHIKSVSLILSGLRKTIRRKAVVSLISNDLQTSAPFRPYDQQAVMNWVKRWT